MRRKSTWTRALGVGVLLCGGVALADDATGGPPVRMSPSDVSWLATTAQDGMTEVQLSDYAQNRATNIDVKQFAAHMVSDHSQANEELRVLVTQKGVSLEATLDAKHQAVVDAMMKTPAAKIDAAYMRQMLADHRMAVHRFARESVAARDADVKAWVVKTLPTLRDHLTMAKKVAKEVLNKTLAAR